MAPHSSTLAWKIPWMEEPGRLHSMGSLRVGWTRLSDFTFTFHFHALEKEMATHSSVLAWRIPGTGEPGGLSSLGLYRVGHDWSDLAVAVAVAATNRITLWNAGQLTWDPTAGEIWHRLPFLVWNYRRFFIEVSSSYCIFFVFSSLLTIPIPVTYIFKI